MRREKSYQAVRGMPDILPDTIGLWQRLEAHWRAITRSYAYREIRFPVLEYTNVFKRAIGDVTDIVEKEMFTFEDRDQCSISLRPEGTASCVRACLEHGLLHNQTQKMWYMGPMFRYEKPQKGRHRQFHHIGVESFGFSDPTIELEQILMAFHFFKKLGILQLIQLEVNSLGSAWARAEYHRELVDYFKAHEDQLDEDSKKRLTKNPLRILDSKNPSMKSLIAQAPKITEHLDPDSQTAFDALKTGLTALGIPYRENPTLVRGLDYYNGIVYEWSSDRLGAQNAVCAGGRYDTLVETLGGRAMPATGFAMGVERLILLYESQIESDDVPQSVDVYLVCQGDFSVQQTALALAEELRATYPTLKVMQNNDNSSFKSQFKKADKLGARWAIILGEAECQAQKVGLKFLREAKKQVEWPLSSVSQFFKAIF